MTLKPLTAKEVVLPGPYEWITSKGVRHVGYIQKDRRGRLSGSFISDEGSSRAISLHYGGDDYCDGTFYGPLVLPSMAKPT